MNMLEPLEQRILASVAIAPFVEITHSLYMRPGAEIEVGNRNNAPGHVKQPPQPPTITPVLPPPVTIIELADPSDMTGRTVQSGESLFGVWNEPRAEDIVQRYRADCWLLGAVEGMVISDPGRLAGMLSMDANGVSFRVSETLIYHMSLTVPTNGAIVGVNGALYPLYVEKYIAARQGGRMAWLDGGWMSTLDFDMGWNVSSFALPTTDAQLCAIIDADYAAGQNITLGTAGAISDGAPLIAGHCYILIGHSTDANGITTYTMRQPWGVSWTVNSITLSNLQNDTYTGSYVVSW